MSLGIEVEVPFPKAYEDALTRRTAGDGLPVRYRAFHGGRGSAKSHSLTQAALLKGYETPLRIGCYREIQRSIKDSVKRLLDDKIAALGLGKFYRSTDTEIQGANGTLFIFNGLRSNPEAVKSTEGLDLAIVFEANKVSQKSWDLLIPTVRKDGSEIWAEWNPEFETDPVDVLFRGEDGPPPGSIVREVNFTDNRYFPEVLKREMEWVRAKRPDKYAHIWLGGYKKFSEAQVFKDWTVEAFDTPSSALRRFGADWGFSTDPSVLVSCWIDGKVLYVDYEAYMVGCEIDQLPTLFASVPDSSKWLITADSARPETISYMQKHGYPKIVSAIKGAKSLEEGVEFLKSFDIVVHPRCQHVIDELSLYSYETDPLTGAVLPRLADKDNHMIDALRYACEGARRAHKPAIVEKKVKSHVSGAWMGS